VETRFRRACAAVVGLLPGPLRRVVAPSMVGFALVNGFTFAVDLVLLSLLIEGLDVPLWAGVSVAYGTASTLSFLLNRWLNFDPERPVGVQVVFGRARTRVTAGKASPRTPR
jgi:putative flippase GtrA